MSKLTPKQEALLSALRDAYGALYADPHVYGPAVYVHGQTRRTARALAARGLVRYYPSGRVDLLGEVSG